MFNTIIKISKPTLVEAIKASRWKGSEITIASPWEALVASRGDISISECPACMGPNENGDGYCCLSCEAKADLWEVGSCAHCTATISPEMELCATCLEEYSEQEEYNTQYGGQDRDFGY